ncbi:MAG: addiction module toxin RelE [Magnetospirillum sp.]|nr:MAG: addiction module toxin RelE [Magnetospirillum sp.]
MKWTIRFHDEFEPEFEVLPVEVQDELLAHAKVLARIGPTLGRPHVDTLTGSKHANMKEMRFEAADGVWRIAFAFDPARAAVLLVAGDKSGMSQKRFYRSLITRADDRFDRHLVALRKKEK